MGFSPAQGSGGGAAVVAASESVSGIAELATQVETDAGSDDLRIVTPLKLTNFSGLGGAADGDQSILAGQVFS